MTNEEITVIAPVRPRPVSNGMSVKILWGVVAGFLAGVFLRSVFPVGLIFSVFTVLLALVSLALSFVNAKKRAALAGQAAVMIAAVLFSGAFGIVRMNAATLSADPMLAQKLNAGVVLEGVVSDEPDVREGSVRIPVRVEMLIVGSSTTPIRSGVLVLAAAHTAVSYGDHIRAEGKLRLPEAFDTGVGRQFDYPLYLAKDGITYELAFAKVESTSGNEGNVLKAGAIWVKQMFQRGLGLALAEPQSGLAGGITVGDKRGVGQELSDTFRRVGLIHIVVLSGYNIMIVIEALSRFLAWMRAPRFLKFGSSVFVALFFVLMTGGAAASMRAGAMAVIAVVGRATGRVYIASRALALVALLMVLWNPFILVFDPGFQLSALATAGLIVFTPLIAPRLKFITTKFGLRETAGATLGTQLAVLPLLLFQNGQLPIYSLPVNLLALVAVPPAMLLSAIAAGGGLFLGPLAPIVGFPASALLSYILYVATFFGNLPFAAVSIPAFSAWWLLPIYGMLFGTNVFLKIRSRTPAA